MKAKVTTGQGSGGSRRKLVDVLPLNTPLAIDVFPIHACNFKCNYCLFSLPIKEQGYAFDTEILNYKVFKKMIDDAQSFNQKIKMLRFVGTGEPLLHPSISEMVKYASEENVAERIEIITNGSLLTHEMSDKLIASGLTQMRISLQGLNATDYSNISGVEINYDDFVDNIKYFYKHKGDIILNLKIADIAVSTDEKLKTFYDNFGNFADSVSIEKISPTASKVDYSKYGFKEENNEYISMRGKTLPASIHICNHPFYLLSLNPDGSVFPCCSTEAPPVMGNVSEQSIVDIWNGKVFNSFRINMLEGVESCGNICKNCKAYRYNMYPEDIITDSDAEVLKFHYDKLALKGKYE